MNGRQRHRRPAQQPSPAVPERIQKIVGEDLPALPLVALQTITVSNIRIHDLYNSVDLTAGDFSDAWLSP